MTEEMKQNRLRYIDGAIWYWEERLKGVVFLVEQKGVHEGFYFRSNNFF